MQMAAQDFFQNLSNNFSSGFFSKIISGKTEESIVGIDFGSSALKVVQLGRRRGKAVLETYGEVSLGPYAHTDIGRATSLEPALLGEALKNLIKEANVTATEAGIAVPLSASLVALIDVPAVPESQLREIMPIEARKYIPVPISEVSLDWWIIPETNRSALETARIENAPKTLPKRQALLVAIHNSAIEKYRQALSVAGIVPAYFELETFSAVRSSLPKSLAPAILIDIGAGTTKLSFVDSGVVLETHALSRGSQEITLAIAEALSISVAEAETKKRALDLDVASPESQAATLALERLFVEIRRSILAFEQRFGKNFGAAALLGGGALLRGLPVFAGKSLEIEVKLAAPFSRVETPVFLGKTIGEAGPELAVAIGVALRKLEEV